MEVIPLAFVDLTDLTQLFVDLIFWRYIPVLVAIWLQLRCKWLPYSLFSDWIPTIAGRNRMFVLSLQLKSCFLSWSDLDSYLYWLVVYHGIPTPLKNIGQLGWLFPYIMEKKKCSKPPTRYSLIIWCSISSPGVTLPDCGPHSTPSPAAVPKFPARHSQPNRG
jgi:hypothetical protein